MGATKEKTMSVCTPVKSKSRVLSVKTPKAAPRIANIALNARISADGTPVRKRTFPPPGIHVEIFDMRAVLK